VKPAAKQAAETKTEAAPPLVTRNGAVTVHSLAAGIRITTAGKSLADASKGQAVLVELADSRDKVLAQVVGPQLVEIRTVTK
jgi:flagella basal body P-ring formation protein FlgA